MRFEILSYPCSFIIRMVSWMSNGKKIKLVIFFVMNKYIAKERVKRKKIYVCLTFLSLWVAISWTQILGLSKVFFSVILCACSPGAIGETGMLPCVTRSWESSSWSSACSSLSFVLDFFTMWFTSDTDFLSFATFRRFSAPSLIWNNLILVKQIWLNFHLSMCAVE